MLGCVFSKVEKPPFTFAKRRNGKTTGIMSDKVHAEGKTFGGSADTTIVTDFMIFVFPPFSYRPRKGQG
jgi:hypothetical protein